MDEERLQRLLDAAIDRLAGDRPPAPARGAEEAQLLALARAVRGLGEPSWPDDPERFARQLLPPPRRRLPASLTWPAAAAAVLAAALTARVPLPAAFTFLGPSGAPATFSFAIRAAPATEFGSSAPSSAPVNSTKATSHATGGMAQGLHGVTAYLPGGVWLQPKVLALRLSGPRAGFVAARDLTGREVRLPARRAGGSVVLDFTGLRPGWYRLSGGPALLLPLPPGGAASCRRAPGVMTRLSGVSLRSVSCGAGGVVARFGLPGPGVGQAIELLGPAGDERPVAVSYGPAAGGMQAAFTFDPVPVGTSRLRFVARGAWGALRPVAEVRIGP